MQSFGYATVDSLASSCRFCIASSSGAFLFHAAIYFPRRLLRRFLNGSFFAANLKFSFVFLVLWFEFFDSFVLSLLNFFACGFCRRKSEVRFLACCKLKIKEANNKKQQSTVDQFLLGCVTSAKTRRKQLKQVRRICVFCELFFARRFSWLSEAARAAAPSVGLQRRVSLMPKRCWHCCLQLSSRLNCLASSFNDCLVRQQSAGQLEARCATIAETLNLTSICAQQ